MKYKIKRLIDVDETGPDGMLKLNTLFTYFQRAAIEHSSSVGNTPDVVMKTGNSWMFNKILLEINEMPAYTDDIEIVTWSRKIDKFKGFREYRIVKDSEILVAASSLWIYVNIEKRRPVRVAEEVLFQYGSEDEKALESEPDGWKPDVLESYDNQKNISLRYSDFDMNNHLNTSSYIDLILTALCDRSSLGRLNRFNIAFMHEIPVGTKEAAVLFNADKLSVQGVIKNAGADSAAFEMEYK